LPFDEKRYAELLADARPAVIENADEHDRLLAVAEGLMEKGEKISAEEERLLALLVLVIEAFGASVEGEEEEDEPAEPPQPFETLNRLLEARGLEPADVAHFFGNLALTKETLAGRRQISRGQAKELGKYFQVPPKLFYT